MIKYFGVVYCHDGTVHLTKPQDTQQECLDKLKSWIEDPRCYERVAATTVIKREMDNFKDGRIFGNPKSLDIMRDKKFIATLTV